MTERPLALAYSGTLLKPLSSDVNNNTELYNLISDRLTKSSGSVGGSWWKIIDEVETTSGSLDRVFKSIGSQEGYPGVGDASIYFRIKQNNTSIQITTYPDWSPFSSDGTTSFTTNPGGSRASSNAAQAQVLMQYQDEIRWWMVIGPHAWHFAGVSVGTPKAFGVEGIVPAAPAGHEGFARIITTMTGTGAVTLELDRELSGTINEDNSVQPGQKIWVVNQTPSGTALANEIAEITSVTSVGNNKISLSPVSGTYLSSSIVGIEPSSAAAYGTTSQANPTLYFPLRTDAGYSGVSSHNADFEWVPISEAGSNPTYSGFFGMGRAVVNSDQTSYTGIRGFANYWNFVSGGPQVSGDLMHLGDRSYFVFRMIGQSTEIIALGPFERGKISD